MPEVKAKMKTKAKQSGAAVELTAEVLAGDRERFRARAQIMKALGHPVRMQVVELLYRQDYCLCELLPLFRMRQPTLSRHLAVLKQAGLLTERQAGPRKILHLATPCILRAFDCATEVVQADHRRRTRAVAEKAA